MPLDEIWRRFEEKKWLLEKEIERLRRIRRAARRPSLLTSAVQALTERWKR